MTIVFTCIMNAHFFQKMSRKFAECTYYPGQDAQKKIEAVKTAQRVTW